MKKAFFFSFLIHALILYLLYLLPLPPESRTQPFPVLFVEFVKKDSPADLPEPQVLPPEPEEITEVPEKPEKPEKPEPAIFQVTEEDTLSTAEQNPDREIPIQQDMPVGTDTKMTESDIIMIQESPLPIGNGQNNMTEEMNAGKDPDYLIDQSIAEKETDTEATSGLDIQWTRGDARLVVSGEELKPDISRNSRLLEQVLISFAVFPDGSVYHVKIIPPGSGDLQVDHQLREWAGLLVFQPAGQDDQAVEGILRVNLTARELSFP